MVLAQNPGVPCWQTAVEPIISDDVGRQEQDLSRLLVEERVFEPPPEFVAEAAVVGVADEIKGQAIAAFVTPKEDTEPTRQLGDELKNT